MPYFVDPGGRACAVAHLALMDDRTDVVRSVVALHNNAYIPEMTSGELLAWARESGFSLEELAIIQPSYCPDDTACMEYYELGPAGSGCGEQEKPDGEPCEPVAACGAGICEAGVCVATASTCDDGDDCTDDRCDGYAGCVHTASSSSCESSSDCAMHPGSDPTAWPLLLIGLAMHRLRRRARPRSRRA